MVKQSVATEAGELQLVLQKVERSSHAVLAGGGSSVTPPASESVSSGGATQSPPRTISSLAAQLAFTPPTQARSPHARVRCCPSLSKEHVQSVRDELQAPNAPSKKTDTSGRARFAATTSEP